MILAPSGSSINFVTLNDISFIPGETIESSDSGINATVSAVTKGSVRISDNYTFDNGQRTSNIMTTLALSEKKMPLNLPED